MLENISAWRERVIHRGKQTMICDNCVCKNKCTKIISEGEKYCRDKIVEAILFRIEKDYLETGYVRYDKSTEWFTKDFLKDYSMVWKKYEYRVF